MRIRSATLIESIVALLLISIAFSISLITFVSVINAGNMNRKIMVHEILRSIAVETKSENKLDEETLSKANIEFSKTLTKVNEKGLFKLTIKAINADGKLLDEYNEYISIDEKN